MGEILLLYREEAINTASVEPWDLQHLNKKV